MDIKARIDGLTEAEAKAALGWALRKIAINWSFERCEISFIQCDVLDEALKEVRR